MIKALFVTGYRPHELGIFNNRHPGIEIIKKALEHKLRQLLNEGLEWVIVSGQLGVEYWTTEVVIHLKEENPQLKYAVITPFLEQEKNWNEQKQEQYQTMILHADFVTSVTKRPYEAPWQFIEKDKFIIHNTDAMLLVYDEENEASPKYVLNLVKKYQEHHAQYELFTINAFDLQIIAEEIQQQDW